MSRFEEIVNGAIEEVVLGEAFKAETLAAHIAERVLERQQGLRAEVTLRARYPEYKETPVTRHPHPGAVHADRGGGGFGAWAAEPGRRGGAGDDRLPLRPGAGRRGGTRRLERTRLHRRRDRPRVRPVPGRDPQPARHRQRSTSAARRIARWRSGAETLLRIVEDSMSSEIYELMKRPDERAVVEKAHRDPRFVEDCVREMLRGVARGVSRTGRVRVRRRAPGEPRDHPPAQRGGGALWPGPGDPQRARVGPHSPPSRDDAGVARNAGSRVRAVGGDSHQTGP